MIDRGRYIDIRQGGGEDLGGVGGAENIIKIYCMTNFYIKKPKTIKQNSENSTMGTKILKQ